MKNLKLLLKRMLHHPNTMTWVLISTMVAIMISYNTIIRYGFSGQMLEKVFIVYPLIVIFIYYLRKYVTLPFALALHQYFPNIITDKIPEHVTVPMLVITFNVSVMMVWFTEMHRQLYPHFLSGYLNNWPRTFFIALPVFFFVVRPILDAVFKKLKQVHPLQDK